MASGDYTVFEELAGSISNLFDLGSDTLSMVLLTAGGTAPLAGDVTPTVLDYTECTAGGNYATGGKDLLATYTEAAGVATLDGTDPTWAVHASNPTDARWGLVQDSTVVGALGFFDLGATIDMTTTALTITLHPSGILTVTVT